jgi:hypothetical protein
LFPQYHNTYHQVIYDLIYYLAPYRMKPQQKLLHRVL